MEPGPYDRGDESNAFDVQWAIPLDEPMSIAVRPEFAPERSETYRDVGESFLLRGGDLPSDGIYRPRLGSRDDAA